MHDTELITGILNGNAKLYEEIIERYQTGVYRTAYYYTQNVEDARDITQEIFIKVYNKLAGFKQGSAFSTWLYRIAVNHCLDWSRRKKPLFVEPACLDSHFDKRVGPEENLLRQEVSAEIQDAIGSLHEIYRTVLILYYFEDFTPQQIADILGTSKRTIETRLFRGRKLLKEELQFILSGGDCHDLLSEQR
ncbi:RNA polymerase sigma factor, sigma-70 family [Desulfosporosinus acidiphilus SJ4]|uniref:RNA polymerase sigma factor, sigma-70 family n=1 Tax=Desulfosporosinus acidiphilus (strain DSM 22704 / JCM 16185 / SJ4) TaxID=646529 RepID=I4D2S1_DESAJ|nr:RNA polymerase sigma factor [Desulfosporosinus acidiphilus]AFM40095.1 RNA polymerase sigma factor, sigma-70 family [Desulfosporosinus acidiphilus SJ4]